MPTPRQSIGTTDAPHAELSEGRYSRPQGYEQRLDVALPPGKRPKRSRGGEHREARRVGIRQRSDEDCDVVCRAA